MPTPPPTVRPRDTLPSDANAYAQATPDDADTDPPPAISTFCGPGGSSVGYERAGFDVVAAVDDPSADNEASASIPATYRANHRDTTVIERDVATLDADDLLTAAGYDPGEIALLDGSPPCSPFSTANSDRAWGDHAGATLFDEFARLVDGVEPKTFVAENVPGLAQGKTTGYFKQLCATLRRAGPGYSLTVHKLDAVHVGAGHHRRRLLFLGTRTDYPDAPALSAAPDYHARRVADSWVNAPAPHAAHVTATRRLERSENYDAYTRIQPGGTLADETGFGWSHYRLESREPAPTLTTQQIALPPTENRAITIPELKRLIGLPDDYTLATGDAGYQTDWEHCVRCLPPELTETLGRHLRAYVLSPGAFVDAETTTLADQLTGADAGADFDRARFVQPHRSACAVAAAQTPRDAPRDHDQTDHSDHDR